ncbi:hypothetical protein BGX38DRAFT_1153187 [Terfezia claveryi]|nr:hypothetical protein BGX38DRAFT_1153187 [Terfezia claveryi]
MFRVAQLEILKYSHVKPNENPIIRRPLPRRTGQQRAVPPSPPRRISLQTIV